jgi:hypothetical protein
MLACVPHKIRTKGLSNTNLGAATPLKVEFGKSFIYVSEEASSKWIKYS